MNILSGVLLGVLLSCVGSHVIRRVDTVNKILNMKNYDERAIKKEKKEEDTNE